MGALEKLVESRAASRVQAKDAALYAFSPAAQGCARDFMGWADLATNPPYPPQKVQELADGFVEQGIRHAVLIGQGGSTQAPMTLTKFCRPYAERVRFLTIDSNSPVRLRRTLEKVDPEHTLFIVSSKSGGTLEPRMMLKAVREAVTAEGGVDEQLLRSHLVAITDPGSNLERQAREEGWAAVLPGEPSVGGRFSALSVFGLFPAALVGLDVERLVAAAAQAERRCASDDPDNPAIKLAAFLFDNLQDGRDKFSYFTQRRGRVLALWIEQLVAESLGKEGRGILPNFAFDPALLASDPGDRAVVACGVENDPDDPHEGFLGRMAQVSGEVPRVDYTIETPDDLVGQFVMWEYATAMCGFLMHVCPFDQPDVAVAKAKVLDILREGQPAPSFVDGEVAVRVSPALGGEATDVPGALRALVGSVGPGDYFVVCAFLPFVGDGRRRALEDLRHAVAAATGAASCLEIGPRYLHSTGQLHKGGPNTGVFLVLSADEERDVELNAEAPSLGGLAQAQATGDWAVLAERGRRAVHLHLPSNDPEALRRVADLVEQALA